MSLDQPILKLKSTRRKWAAVLWILPISVGLIFGVRSWMLTKANLDSYAAVRRVALALTASTNHGWVMLDKTGLVVEWNQAMENWTGRTRDEMVGQTLESIMSPESWEKHRKAYDLEAENGGHKLSGGKVIRIDCDVVNKLTKETIPIRVSVRLVEDNDGKSPWAVGFVELRESEELVIPPLDMELKNEK